MRDCDGWAQEPETSAVERRSDVPSRNPKMWSKSSAMSSGFVEESMSGRRQLRRGFVGRVPTWCEASTITRRAYLTNHKRPGFEAIASAWQKRFRVSSVFGCVDAALSRVEPKQCRDIVCASAMRLIVGNTASHVGSNSDGNFDRKGGGYDYPFFNEMALDSLYFVCSLMILPREPPRSPSIPRSKPLFNSFSGRSPTAQGYPPGSSHVSRVIPRPTDRIRSYQTDSELGGDTRPRAAGLLGAPQPPLNFFKGTLAMFAQRHPPQRPQHYFLSSLNTQALLKSVLPSAHDLLLSADITLGWLLNVQCPTAFSNVPGMNGNNHDSLSR
ncbi:hypothetical protein FB45DRAFT_882914 [Roridomyces roridus]|uniref:Uncharacterized protein n=1 Tax=Roridomyces roridus TaxID=1738132 RepID=A0AAD7AX71_9AGAR|nr:hypothetical protein FB45DRAFT_882914 [Roridomyces roridus]